MSTDWMAREHTALHDQAQRTWNYASTTDNATRMGMGPDTPLGLWMQNTFYPVLDQWMMAYQRWVDPVNRTPAQIGDLRATEEQFKPLYRELYTGFLKNNPLVTDYDLIEMSLPTRSSGGNTPAPTPTTAPEATVVLPMSRVVEIHFQDAGSERKAKPAGVHGAEIAWAILPAAPAKQEELNNSSFDTHTPFRLEFDIDQCGQHVYFTLRWENTRGEKGPWSPIYTTVIP